MKSQQYKSLLQAMPVLAFTLNKNGIFLFINQYSHKLLGYHPAELTGKSISDIEATEQNTKSQKTFSIGEAKDIEKRQRQFIKKDGSKIQVCWFGKWDDDDKVWHCYAHAAERHTVNSQLQTVYEKRMKRYHQRLSSILDRIGEGFVALDEEGRVIYWNRQAEMISGKQREEVVTQKIWECYPEMATPEFCSFYKNAIERQVHQQYQAYYRNEGKWIEIVLHPGNRGVTAFFRDITDQKKIENELEVHKKQVNKKITAAVIQAQENERSQISRELHDNVNQVLTTVKLYIELCANDLGNKELMHKSINLLQSCIDEIRSLSKQLSAPSLGNISLKESVKDLVKTMAATGKSKIQLNTKGIQDIKVNKELHLAIYRILQEHLTNILKHASAKNVRIVINYLDDEIILKVSDDGEGFNLKDTPKGIGIDNMISRAESLGGRLTINSAPGLGCVLIVHLPKA